MAKGIHSRPQNMAKVLEGLAKHGINIDLNMVQDVVDNGPQQRALAQEAMLLTLAVKPPKLIQRECTECKETFGTNYLYVSYQITVGGLPLSVMASTTAHRRMSTQHAKKRLW